MNNSFYSTLLLGLLYFFLLLFKLSKPKVAAKSKKQHETKLPPGPWRLPIIGSMHHLIGKLTHHALRDLARSHGPLMHLKLGEMSTMVVSSADVAREVTKTHDICFASRAELVAARIMLYGNSDLVFAPYGDYWRQVRKLFVVELLSAKRVQSFGSIREDEVSKFIQAIGSAGSSSPVNVSVMLSSLAADIIARAAFGNESKDKETFVKATKEALEFGSGLCLADLFPSIPLVRALSCIDWRLRKHHRNVDSILNSIIDERKKWKAIDHERENFDSKGAERNILDVLLSLQQRGADTSEFSLSMDSIKALIIDIFQAGSGTTGSTASWAMSELIKNPRVMKKVQSEVRHVFAGESKITDEVVGQLSYLKLVIKEVLRLHPSTPLLVPRECIQSCEINGYQIPTKARVLVNVWALGRDPNYWEDPEAFKPERFEGGQIDFQTGNFEYIPFGAGRRMCPGILFGMATVEHALARLLYHFDWSMPHGMRPEDLDMAETPGPSSRRKHDLVLCAAPFATP